MKIKTVKIQNLKSIKDLSIDLEQNLNVLVGVNGSGKTTILEAISTSLSWLINRIQRQNASGIHISESEIRNESTFSSIEIKVTEDKKNYNWKIFKIARGNTNSEKSELNEVSVLATLYQETLSNESKLPVIVYYPVNRSVDKAIPELKIIENFDILDVYRNALNGKRNYQSFFEWFRLQDDIVNEEAMSRSKWFQQKQVWIKQQVNSLIKLIEDIFNFNEKNIDNEKFKNIMQTLNRNDFIYKEPRYFFHELSGLIGTLNFRNQFGANLGKTFDELQFMLMELALFGLEYSDDFINAENRYVEITTRIFRGVIKSFNQLEPDTKIMNFICEAFVFANLLSLWWVSDKTKQNVEKLIRDSFSGIKNNEIETGLQSENLSINLRKVIEIEVKKKNTLDGKELKFVINAIEQFVPEYTSLRVKRMPTPQMLINKGKKTYNLNQLSDGEKNLITLVGDIARRLTIANPASKDPLKGEGIILIDEIDLHLHPSWQRMIIPQLAKVFPNCQFIITTHSPLVISQIQPESIFLLKNINNELSFSKANESFGMNADRILEDLLGVDARPIEEKKQLHNLFKLIQNGEINKAKHEIANIREKIGDDPELIKAEVLIKRKEIIGK